MLVAQGPAPVDVKSAAGIKAIKNPGALVPAAEDFTRRWVSPVDKDVGPSMIDSFDRLKTAVSVDSEYAAVHAAAVAREWDDRIIAAAFATATALRTALAAFVRSRRAFGRGRSPWHRGGASSSRTLVRRTVEFLMLLLRSARILALGNDALKSADRCRTIGQAWLVGVFSLHSA